ncbi:hypothetical protein GCM10020367_21740 [Streptomyces sannanensis]|uniref:YcxB-like C-terminal domain-containing protein n=1 Tax=Streptomyces sannanensis TaxID=285536 RepID=A0ABP6S9N0_9ACTN
MTQGRDTEQVVELVYQPPTTADITAALRARTRGTPSGRRLRVFTVVCVVLSVLLAGVSVFLGGGDVPFPVVAMGVILPFTLWAVPLLQARQLRRLAESQGEFRAEVDDTEVRVTTENSNVTIGWRLLKRYAETEELFVLLSADKHAVGITVLPKRGARQPADVDRLRAILDRHLERV